jgi:hypothetical protein
LLDKEIAPAPLLAQPGLRPHYHGPRPLYHAAVKRWRTEEDGSTIVQYNLGEIVPRVPDRFDDYDTGWRGAATDSPHWHHLGPRCVFVLYSTAAATVYCNLLVFCSNNKPTPRGPRLGSLVPSLLLAAAACGHAICQGPNDLNWTRTVDALTR